LTGDLLYLGFRPNISFEGQCGAKKGPFGEFFSQLRRRNELIIYVANVALYDLDVAAVPKPITAMLRE
jgi:hypothetical protein